MYGGQPYAGGPHAGDTMLAAAIPVDVEPRNFAVEVSFTTDALAEPVWVDISGDVRAWDTTRGRSRELERFQPGRATVVLDNTSGAYDSANATGPWFGNLRPMRRIRIRETFSGATYPRFDGYVDRWQLDTTHVDSTVTVTATDGFKVLNQTDLGVSVYANTVGDDNPKVWWRLDDNQVQQGDVAATALNSGSTGTADNGTFVGPPTLGEQGLIVHDPGTAMRVTDATLSPGTGKMGVELDGAFNLTDDGASFAVECWVRPAQQAANAFVWFNQRDSASEIIQSANCFYIDDANYTQAFVFLMRNSAAGIFGVESPDGFVPHKPYHLVCKHGPNRAMTIYVNGVAYTTVATDAGATATTTTGTIPSDALCVGYRLGGAFTLNWAGAIDEFAVYQSAEAVDPLPAARVSAHYIAGTTPWTGDLPGVRAGRVLDEAGWPASLRELDAGATTFQSAAIDGQTVLEHLQKTAETEAGAVFVNRSGHVRLISRAALATRVSQATFGDGAGEIGYRAVRFDDGDATIKNRATISRLNGVAKTASDAASVAEFGTQQYTLDGLLHNTEAHSQSYATWVVTNYEEPARRVVGLEAGPAKAGAEATLYAQILGREIGDVITVKVRPTGGGTAATFVVAIEGEAHRWDPHGMRTATWTLSPIPGTF